MIVIGAAVVEEYLGNCRKRDQVEARSAYRAWLQVVAQARWRRPEQLVESYPKAVIGEPERVEFRFHNGRYILGARLHYKTSVLAVERFEKIVLPLDQKTDCKRELIVVTSDTEHRRAMQLLVQLWDSSDPASLALFEAQARLIAGYEEGKWPRTPPPMPDLVAHFKDQHSSESLRPHFRKH